MAQTKTLLISNAVCLLGHSPVVTLDDADDLVVSAEQAYNLLLPGVLSRNNWRFATQIQQLSESVETPPDPWETIYLLPAGYLKLIRLYPQTYNYDIFENKKLYAKFSGEVYMEYIFEPDVSLLPPRFTEYFVYEIASYLALSNAQRPDYQQVLEQRRKEAFAMAAASEAQNRPQFSQATFPVLQKRFVSDIDNSTDIDL